MINKIAFVIGNFNNGAGTERCTAMIANGLFKSGYSVSIISCKEGLTPVFEVYNGIDLFSLHQEKCKSKNPLARKIRLYKTFKRIVFEQKFDLIVAVDIQLYILLHFFQKRYKFKTIAWEHFNCSISCSKFTNISRRMAAKAAEKIIVLSNGDLQSYKNRYKKIKNITHIYNPIAFDIKNNFNVCSRRIIAAGRLEKQKGFDLLIEAWKLIEPLSKDWELEIFGEGSLELELKNQINNYGLKKIHIKGFANDLQKELENAGIFAFSSRYEGFGLVLLEAQAQGLPIISFNCKEGPAEIIDDGVNGFLVDPGDVNDFAEKLLKLMLNDNLRISFSNNSQKDLNRFHIDNVIKKWIEVLNEISMN